MTGPYIRPPERRGYATLVVGLLALLGIVVALLVLGLLFRVGPFGAASTQAPSVPLPTNSQPLPQHTDPPTPTQPATDQPTEPPIGQPTPPSIPAGPPFSPGDPATAELLSHIPVAIQPSCTPGIAAPPVEATLTCAIGEIAISYSAYVDVESLRAAYDLSFDEAQIERDTGLCYDTLGGVFTATRDRWPAEHRYSIGGEPAGRYLCIDLGEPSIVWTDERFEILAAAVASGEDLDRFVSAWINELGPVP